MFSDVDFALSYITGRVDPTTQNSNMESNSKVNENCESESDKDILILPIESSKLNTSLVSTLEFAETNNSTQNNSIISNSNIREEKLLIKVVQVYLLHQI